MTIHTAYPYSLIAVYQAAQLLRSGGSDVAVAAGAGLIVGPLQYVGASRLHVVSADSRSRMWDVDASGYARGEGVGAVTLKRLSSAFLYGDNIECIIRESGVNQGGRIKGITMPSSAAQADLIARTYAKAATDPRNPNQRCQYFEAHGTGIVAADPKVIVRKTTLDQIFDFILSRKLKPSTKPFSTLVMIFLKEAIRSMLAL